MHCLTISLAESGAGLGTVWKIQTARGMLADAGFSDIEVLDSPRPQNCIYLRRPWLETGCDLGMLLKQRGEHGEAETWWPSRLVPRVAASHPDSGTARAYRYRPSSTPYLTLAAQQ
jgi:hypothetical protein